MKPRLRLALLAGACAASWALYLKISFFGYFEDPCWYLEPARSFARGLGLATRILYPAQLAQFPPGVALPVPPLHHGPLALYALGWCYRLFGINDWAPLVYGFGLLLAIGLLVYRLGAELGGERVGLTAAALYWTHPKIIASSRFELTDPMFTLLITTGALCLWRARKGRAAEFASLSGIFLGLATATRLAGQTYWLAFFAGAWYLLRSGRALAAMAGGFVAAMIPLLIYNHRAAGLWFYSPGIYVLQWSHSFSGFRSSTTFMNLTTFQAIAAYPRDVAQKIFTGIFYAAGRFVEESQDAYVGVAILLGLLVQFKPRPAETLRRWAWIMLIPVAGANILVSYGAVQYLLPLFPILVVLAALWLWRFIDENPWLSRARRATVPLALLLFLGPYALELKGQWKTREQTRRFVSDLAAFGEFVKQNTRPGEVLYADAPATVTWYADRPAVALTATLDDARQAFDCLPPAALALSTFRVHSEDYDPAWGAALDGKRAVLGFVPCAEFSAPSLSAALYRPAGSCPRGGAPATPRTRVEGRPRTSS